MARLRSLFSRSSRNGTSSLSRQSDLDIEDAEDPLIDLESQPRPTAQTTAVTVIELGLQRAAGVPLEPVDSPAASDTATQEPGVRPEGTPQGSREAQRPPLDAPPSEPEVSDAQEARTTVRKTPDIVPIASADATQFARTVLAEGHDLRIGELLHGSANLSAEQVEAILEHQRVHGTRFGESAVALGYAQAEDVLRALSRQFGYDYAPDTRSTIPLSDDLVVAKHPFSQAAEVIRDLRSQLLQGVLGSEERPRRALAMVSLNQGDGKTWFAANLAVSLSQLGARTLLVDANLRSPKLHTLFDLHLPATGLTAILRRRHSPDVIRPLRELPHLYLLPAGPVPPNPLELLQGRGFGDLMATLRTKFTHVIIDTPSMDVGADARVIAARAGASLLIGRRHHSALQELNAVANQLLKSPGHLAGLVINEH